MPPAGLIATLALIAGVFASVAAHSPHGSARAAAARHPAHAHTPAKPARAAAGGGAALSVSNAKLLGQRIMVGFSGTVAPSWVLSAARGGRIGSVILFAPNVVGRAQLKALTGSLQHAARSSGNPALLIA